MERSGTFVENLAGEVVYRSFRPAPLPPVPPVALDSESLRLLLKAARDLQRLDDLAAYVPNMDLLVASNVRKEALLSSQIEGTQCTLEDVLDPDAESSADADVADVVNCAKATSFALERMQGVPLCNRLLRETHEVLVSGVRGEEKAPGEFRSSQNWIGPQGAALKDARYIPPNAEDMASAMADLEQYMNEPSSDDALVRAALIHYQFETIHPFLDGNGRIGRLLVLLYLMNQGIVSKPVVPVSYFLKKHQVEYYDRMAEVRRSGNYEQWVRFFLEALDEAAVSTAKVIEQMWELRERNLAAMPPPRGENDNLRRVYSYAERQPIFTIKSASAHLGLSYNSVASHVGKLCDLGILEETTNAARNRVFAYVDYIAILKEGIEH